MLFVKRFSAYVNYQYGRIRSSENTLVIRETLLCAQKYLRCVVLFLRHRVHGPIFLVNTIDRNVYRYLTLQSPVSTYVRHV